MKALSNNTAIHFGTGINITCRKMKYGAASQHVVDCTMDRAAVTCLRCLAKMGQPVTVKVAAVKVEKKAVECSARDIAKLDAMPSTFIPFDVPAPLFARWDACGLVKRNGTDGNFQLWSKV